MSYSAVNRFCKQVGSRLQCTAKTKEILLRGLSDELLEYSPSEISTLSGIEACVGTVSQVAEELQATVPAEEIRLAQRKHRRRTGLAIGGIVVIALLLLAAALFIFVNGPFYVVESIQELP